MKQKINVDERKKMYNENEQKILSHFFTNIDKNVYCATDNMPMELWALLLGGYSRSSESMRDRFLQVFKDISNESDENITYNDLIQQLVSDLGESSNTIKKALQKASNFMSKWAINYGHNSLKDSCFNMIAIEQVSIKASKVLEDSKQGAFQEKSTRYMDFSGDSISEYANEDEGRALLEEAMKIYDEVKIGLVEYYKTKINRDDFKTENAWIRTCNAKTFDDARYLLPTSIKTSLGVTMTTRETERWISKLLSHSLKEIRDLGEEIKNECVKITPSLIKHISENKFLNRDNSKLIEKLGEFDSTINKIVAQDGLGVVLQESSNIEMEVAHALIISSGLWDEDHLLNTINGHTLDEFYNLILGDRGPHDDFPQETAVGMLHFDIVCDIGAFRDIQRHRVGTQIIEKWNAFRGYAIPNVFDDESLSDLRTKYVEIMDKITEYNKKITNENNVNSEYYLLLGHNVRFTYYCDFKQFAYLVELRSGESGHYSYRKIAQDMYKLFEGKFPTLAKYIRVNMSGYTDRRAAEEKIEEKIQNNLKMQVDVVKPTKEAFTQMK